MKRHSLLRLFALLVSTVPVLICTAAYFPIWTLRGEGAVLSGLGLILSLIAAIPAYRYVKAHIGSISAPFIWLILFAVFFALESIAHEVTVIAFVGFVSNLVGAIIFKIARGGNAENEGKRI
jgi:hypothetical protein